MLKPHLVAYIDILGFKELVESEDFARINRVYDQFNHHFRNTDKMFEERILNFGKDLDPHFTLSTSKPGLIFFSDCVVWAYPLDDLIKGGYWHSVMQFLAVLRMLQGGLIITTGILLRGGVAIGNLFIDNGKVFGKGLVEAYKLEKSTKYPRIQIQSSILDWKPGSDKSREVMLRQVGIESDGSGDSFISPIGTIKLMNSNLVVETDIGLVQLRRWTEPLYNLIQKNVNHPKEDVKSKYEWLQRRLFAIENLKVDLSQFEKKPT